MATFRNCPRCGKLFANDAIAVCQQCIAKEESDFKLVKEYVYDHENANIIEVSEATGVTTHRILRFLREGRLILNMKEGGIELSCESCGTAIPTGRYCPSCKNELESDLKQALDSAPKNKNDEENASREVQRMYTASHRRQLD